jgi:hypothetical protein
MSKELKAEAYDLLVQIEQIQANMIAPRQKRLQDINTQIAADAQAEAKAKEASKATPVAPDVVKQVKSKTVAA